MKKVKSRNPLEFLSNRYFNDYARFVLFTYPTVITPLIASRHTTPHYSFNYIYVRLAFFPYIYVGLNIFSDGNDKFRDTFKKTNS